VRVQGLSALWRVMAAILVMAAVGSGALAHEIPSDVKLNVFFKPAGNRLLLLVRAPLAAMNEAEVPTRGPGYIDLARADEALRGAAKVYLTDNITVTENDTPLPAPRVVHARISLPSDKSFASYEEALAHLEGAPLDPSLELYWTQQLLDVLLEYPIQSDRSEFAIEFSVDRLGRKVTTALRFIPSDGNTRAFEFHGDIGRVYLDPRWHQAALSFVVSGFWHILEGTDHLLFLACLVIPFRRLRPLVVIVTSFTVAHSITLIASAFGFAPDGLWFPPLIETLIATSIVYMALENIVFAGQQKKPQSAQSTQREDDRSAISASSAVFSGALKRRWLVTFGFGLVHGFGFSFALRQTLQFAGTHLLTSLLSFNIGVELGQLLVLIVLIPALGLVFRYVVDERIGTIILSAIVAHTASHWLGERWELLRKFRFEWPAIDAAFLAGALRWMMLLVAAAALYWFVFGVLRPPRNLKSEI
jgi:HupE / UreJ protein